MRRIISMAAAIAAGLLSLPTLAEMQPGEAKFRDLYKELIETNTALSSGNCTLAAERMAARLKAAGMAPGNVQVLTAPDHPKEGGLVAIYPGTDPTLKAILLLAHIDVVEAKREDWTRDPFTLVEENGSFYARGAIDDKAEAAIWTDTLVRFSEEKYRPRRTVKLALTCGEETAGAFNGAQWLSENRRDLIDAAFAINEGAIGELDADGRRVALEIQAGEKTPQNYRLEVTNPGGHSSRPLKDNAIYRLAAALTRIEAYEFPGAIHRCQQSLFLGNGADSSGQGRQDHRRRNERARQGSERSPGHRTRVRQGSELERHLEDHLRRDHAGCGTRDQRAAAARACQYQLPDLSRCVARISAAPIGGAGRGSGGESDDAGNARTHLCAAAAHAPDTGSGAKTQRHDLSRSSGSADSAGRRHGRRVSDRSRHPDVWHRAHIRRSGLGTYSRAQRVCQCEIPARWAQFSLSSRQGLRRPNLGRFAALVFGAQPRDLRGRHTRGRRAVARGDEVRDAGNFGVGIRPAECRHVVGGSGHMPLRAPDDDLHHVVRGRIIDVAGADQRCQR